MAEDRQCKLCNELFSTRYKLINHLRRDHKKAWCDYVLEFTYNGIIPVCACGCNSQFELTSLRTQDYFKKYKHGHSWTGKTHTVETKQRIGEKNSINQKRYCSEHPDIVHKKAARMREFITTDTLAKISIATKQAYKNLELRAHIGDKVRVYWENNPERRIEISAKCKATYAERSAQGKYVETNQKLSEMMSNKLLNSEIIWQRGEFKSTKNSKICRYKSSYEFEVMEQLDALNLVTSWGYETLSIKYIDETGIKTRRYIPDFIITLSNNKTIMLEAKPRNFINTPRSVCKITAGLSYCEKMNMKYLLWWPELCTVEQLLLTNS